MKTDDLTLGEIKGLISLFNQKSEGLDDHVGDKVIIRTYSEG